MSKKIVEITESMMRGLEAADTARRVLSEMKAGKLSEGMQWNFDNGTTLKEMIKSTDGGMEFIEKVTYEAYSGRELVPLLYTPLYDTRVNRAFPRYFKVHTFGYASCVFLDHLEGEEVEFGTLEPGKMSEVEIITFAAGLQVTEEMIEYNEFWNIDEGAKSMGESYNKKLNHIHFYPILNGTYTASAGTDEQRKKLQIGNKSVNAIPQLIEWDTNLQITLEKALRIWPGGLGINDFKVLVNSTDYVYLQENLKGMVVPNTNGVSTYVKDVFTPDRFIVYDGSEVVVGDKTYEYPGVQYGYMYIVAPKKQFREYIKHDLIIDTGDADLSRLIESQQVGRARRGVLAQLGGRYGAMKIDIRS